MLAALSYRADRVPSGSLSGERDGMYKLYGATDSGSFAPQAVLEELGADYELITVALDEKGTRTPEFLAINPLGQIPVLVLPDGTVMTESAAMVVYLADTAPQAGLLPAAGDTGRATALRWLFLLAANVYEADLRYYYAERYAGGPACAAEVKTAAQAHMRRTLDLVEAALDPGPFLLGERYSVVDPYLCMLGAWYPQQDELAALPRILRHRDAVRARPAVASIWDKHHPS